MKPAPKAKTSTKLRRIANALLVVLAIGYPVSLITIILLLRFIGETHWMTSFGLYLPRLGFAAPLVVLLPWLVLARRWRWLALEGVAVLVLLFPLMGLTLNFRTTGPEPRMRVLSFNISSGDGGIERVMAEVLRHEADLVLLQEAQAWRVDAIKQALGPRYPHFRFDDQFVIASKYRIVEVTEPAKIQFQGRERSPRFIRYVVETPLGTIAVFNLHTVSPRGAFLAMRGAGMKRELASGRFFAGEYAASLQDHTALERLQVQAMVDMAAKESRPILIVGDSNLPTLSRTRGQLLGGFRDGFKEAGLGFGYTFPARFPWMRIDLLLTSPELGFDRVEVGAGEASDHLCVFGDLGKRP